MRVLAPPHATLSPSLTGARTPAARPAPDLGPAARRPRAIAAMAAPDLLGWAAGRIARERGETGEETAVVATDGLRVSGADERARRAGVRVGDAVGRARGLLADLVAVRLDAAAAAAAWDAVVATAYRATPFLEPARPGLAFLGGLTPLEAEALAAETGASVGLAASRGTAWLAALAAGEARARAVTNDLAFLERAPAYLLRGAGVSREVVERLELFGLHRLGSLRRLTRRQLEAQFGPDAARLARLAAGEDDAPLALYRPPDEPSARFDFDWPAAEPADWLPALDRTLERALGALGERFARVVTVVATSALGATSAQQLLKRPARDARTLATAARRLLMDVAPPGGLELESLRLTLGGVFRPVPRQDSLFGALERAGVRAAIEAVDARYPGSLCRVELLDAAAYLPERRFRLVALGGDPREEAAASGKGRGKPRKGTAPAAPLGGLA